MSYYVDRTLIALHYRKAMYQRSMLLAWVVVLILLAVPTILLLYPTARVGPIVGGGSGRFLKGPELGRAGGHSRGGDRFPGQANVQYKIVRESSPALPTVGGHIVPVRARVMTYGPTGPVGRPDITAESGTGVGVGRGMGSGYADFGLPGRPLYAHTLSTARWPGWGRGDGDFWSGVGSPAVIEWVSPLWPKKAPVNAEVAALVQLAADGTKHVEAVRTDTWIYFNSDRTTVQFFLGTSDPWGFARAVVSALETSIFWPATDGRGNNIPGDFLIIWRFCRECPPDIQQIHVVRGDVVLRPGRD